MKTIPTSQKKASSTVRVLFGLRIFLIQIGFVYFCSSFSFAQLIQPDGSVIPRTNNLANLLNRAPLNENISVIDDASLVPEVFTPSNTLTFSFIAEGGGYENAFGWYNLGDDVTLPQNRFIIFDCYVEPRNPYVTATINFCGNPQWKGGPIGFFLITPERRDGGGGRRPNCALNDNVGYIYYSEPRLNIDEDPNSTFIHHLVYRSNTFPNAFYFGFEDLFRGGDNDFEDALILVEGLLVGDVPEICDGFDDDCDGRIDEGAEVSCSTICGQGLQLCENANLGTCSAPDPTQEVCDGVDNDCDGSLDEGLTEVCSNECGQGIAVCLAGTWSNCTAQTPQVESCNNVDEDCDGQVDEGLSIACANGCGVSGIRVCNAGSYGTCDAPPPVAESCDGLDNDCDGTVDEGVIRTCESSCGVGIERCENAQFIACDAPIPTEEVCDGVDNDCDGFVDEQITRSCSSICDQTTGIEQCLGGIWIGCTALQPRPETCNLNDDDCDGQIDENLEQICNNACGEGIQICQAGAWSSCDAPWPQLETCNGQDEDCDGLIDEGVTQTCQGACGNGLQACIAGQFLACNVPPPQEEECNGLDDDCDGFIDEQLERICDSLCGAGNELCIEGQWIDCNAPTPKAESCNALDDDCDGLIDESLVTSCENPCGEGMSICELGRWSECPATSATEEFCNALDDDCDGLSDEQVICPEDRAICVRGECALPCSSGECPIGQECVNDVCLNVPCQTCRSYEICENDLCIDPCAHLNCQEGQYCYQGECINGDCYTNGCENGKICSEGVCLPDDCELVSCGLFEGCIEGRCFPTCTQITCGEGEICTRGECISDPCQDVICNDLEQCHEGVCEIDPCNGLDCLAGRICQRGNCVDDPCQRAHCPSETECVYTSSGIVDCVSLLASNADEANAGTEAITMVDGNEDTDLLEVDTEGQEKAQAISGGCDQRNRFQKSRSFFPLFLFIMIAYLWRRIRLFLLTSFQSSSTSCKRSDCRIFYNKLNIYPFILLLASACNQPTDIKEIAPEVSTDDDPFLINGCAPKIEICNGEDDDCDGIIDNVTALDRDPDNCGTCGIVCEYPSGEASCIGGVCRLSRCLPGFVNADGISSNGCEATCDINEAVPEGEDICNQRDDDCNGVIDEGFNLGQDPENCGGCGINCYALGVEEATCLSGRCVIGACSEGYLNLDGQASNGCEYTCEAAGATEVCNGLDDDCDGQVDEDITIEISCFSDGLCAGVRAECRGEDGVVCAYPEEVELGGEIRCDGRDEDCDGQIDEEFMGLGEPCDGDDEDSCFNGIQRCSSDRSGVVCDERIRETERCDGEDNDCDQMIDEGFLLLFDPLNCGECGKRCSTPNTESICRDGRCQLVACEQGYIDLDQNPENGCEYACINTVEEDQGEQCDGIDNDCDGRVDEEVVIPETITCLNQGVCSGSVTTCLGERGFICTYPDTYEPIETLCDNRDNDCDGLIDEIFPTLGTLCDGDDEDLCPGGIFICNPNFLANPEPLICTDDLETITELCDGVDNDCDQQIDEDFDFLQDFNHCGRCGLNCTSPNAQTHCIDGSCEVINCGENYYDLNQVTLDGCEYYCEIGLDGIELCNGQDDDCDGKIDEDVNPPVNLSCEGLGICQGIRPTCQGTAGFVCTYPTEVYQMIETRCDQLDNDCDGQIDEAANQPSLSLLGTLCGDGVGACAQQGVYICAPDQSSVYCSAQRGVPTQELCNGIDDDCDGQTDEQIDRVSEMALVTVNGTQVWIDKWEASRPDASAQSIGLNIDRACSKPGVKPWANVTLNEAQEACAARGKRLCTDREWQSTCGVSYPYGSTYDEQACVTNVPEAGLTGSSPLCQRDGVFDMSGNLAEWTTCATPQDCQIVNPQLGGSFADRVIDIWRCDFRGNAVPNIATATAGFRCCEDN